jgi:hypothetical protein
MRRQPKARAGKPTRKAKKTKAAISQPLVDIPFRSDVARTGAGPKLRSRTRAIDLPFQSQLLPGATAHHNDCGPACVRMGLDFLSLAPGITIDQLSSESGGDSTTADQLVTLAQAYGATASTWVGSANAMPPAPAILLVRYSGFRPETIEDTRYWQLSAADASYRHWAWWLGNEVIDGQTVSLWNDPLFSSTRGKNLVHSLDELNAAFAPYGANNIRLAVTFPAITSHAPVLDGNPIIVEAFDAGGLNFRSVPSTHDPNTIIQLMPQGQRFTVIESAISARNKLASGGQNFWLSVRAPVNGVQRDGFVAAWLVRQVQGEGSGVVLPPPPPIATYTWQQVINASVVAAARTGGSWEEWLQRAGYWNVFREENRALPYTGPAVASWPLSPEQINQMLSLLALSPDALIAEVIRVQEETEQGQQTKRTGAIIGIHGPPGIGAPPRESWESWIATLKDTGVRWYKQCDDGDKNRNHVFDWAQHLKQNGIEPIIRYLVDRQFPDPMPEHYFDKMRQYANAGITWAEIGNEPNLDYEWKEGWNGRVNYNDPEVIRLLAENWVRDAQRALNVGVRPAFYAIGPTDWRGGTHPSLSSVYFTSRLAIYLAEHRRTETMDIFRRGGWFAVHTATYEQPDDFDPFRPDGTIWDVTLRGYEIVRKCFRDTFGSDLDVDRIPIMSTEGGVFTPDSTSMGGHIRLNTDEEHAQRVVSMFNWLEAHSPLQAMCPWCISADGMGGPFDVRFQQDGWFRLVSGSLQARPVVGAMQQLRASLELTPRATRARETARQVPAEPTPELQRRLREIGIFEMPNLPKAPKTKTPTVRNRKPARTKRPKARTAKPRKTRS